MNTFGRIFRVSVFGESHGEAIGAVIDGVPAGIAICEDDFSADIDRRRSGAKGTTPRREADIPEILSGVYEGHTTGAPLAVIFRNGNTRSGDYSLFKAMPRPGHTDRVADIKWNGYNDPRGGGHFSGRLTLPVVAAGVVAKKILSGISVTCSLVEVGGLPYSSDSLEIKSIIDEAARDGDSLGGVAECIVDGLPAGLGEPFFDSVESLVAHSIFAVPGVRGIEFGDGFASARMKGSEHNDVFGEDGLPATNGAGGVNGGITNGAQLRFRVAFKPTASIRKAQRTLNFAEGMMDELEVPGRHDVCFALRAPVVVEAMTAIVLADLVAVG
ncbi:MAG: chorismate synthase [Bacteroidales bacterium]|nr:chorismate synthase [Bacteroidales bacterium]